MLQVNITGYWDLYNRVLSDSTSLARAGAMPSSGLLGEPRHLFRAASCCVLLLCHLITFSGYLLLPCKSKCAKNVYLGTEP